jgi:hypothetical protein
MAEPLRRASPRRARRRPRPGAARNIGDDLIEAVVVETLESAPKDATHWSTRTWRPNMGSATPRRERSGGPSGSNPSGRTSLRSLLTPTWSKRSVTSSAST